MKAWRTFAIGVESIVWADTRGKAMHKTVRSARDAGWRIGMFDVRAVRAKRFDGLDHKGTMRPDLLEGRDAE